MVAIVLFHLRPTPLVGGFIGVPIFFVLSGFFITTGIDRRLSSGTFHYGRYQLHRLTRIWPPMMASIFLAVILSAIFAPEYLPKMARDGWASALLLSNWWLIIVKIPYFAAAGLPSPLKPLWFVALIMQFYLVWALLLWALRTLFSDRIVLAITLALMIASSVEMGLLYDPADSGRVYYGLDTRFAELLAGAALAMLWEMTGGAGRWHVSKRVVRSADGLTHSVPGDLEREEWIRPGLRMWLDLAAWIALIVLVLGCFVVDGRMGWVYHGGFLAAAVLSCVVLAACLAGGSLARVLSLPPLRHLGLIAFSLYLVHFPILEVINPATRMTTPNGWQLLGQVLVVWAAAELFHWLIEKGTAAGAARWRKILTRVVAICGAVSVVILTIVPMGGWEGYADTRRSEAITAAIRQEKKQEQQQEAARKAAEKAERRKQAEKRHNNGAKSKETARKRKPTAKKSPLRQEMRPQPARGGGIPQAAKIPANLDAGRWSWDARKGMCDAPVLIIGDSVVLGAKADIGQAFPHVVEDAAVGRQFGTGVGLFHDHAARHEQGDVVVMALGANGPIASDEQIRQAVDAVKGMPIFFVTIRGPMTWTDPNNALLRSSVTHYSNAGLLDWNADSAGHPEYFYDDGTHLTPGPAGGRQAWMRMLRRALCGV